jgi:ATP-dependent DNA helicase RecG
LDKKQLMEIISKGESLYVEFKEVLNSSFVEEIVAFLNTEGGHLIVGVSDSGEILGINDEIEEKIMNMTRDSINPSCSLIYEEVMIGEKKVVVLNVEKGKNKPYYTKNDRYYVRVGTTKRIASKDELLRLFEAGGFFHYDISPIENTSIKDINLDEVRDFFEKFNSFDIMDEDEQMRERILLNADILKENGDKINCTVGGLLIFGKKPQSILFQTGISFAHFDGKEISEILIDKKEIQGRMTDVVDQAMVIIRNNIITSSTIENAKRKEQQQFDDVMLREAIVNALVHRNYSIQGSRIRIFLFDDRIEFRSPGRIPNTVTLEKMKIGVSYARNPFLVKYMENMRYIDKLGRGIPMIFSRAKKNGKKEPKMEVLGEEFILTLYS